MANANSNNTHTVELNGRITEQVECSKYLGTITEKNGKLDKELDKKIGKTERLFNILRSAFLFEGTPNWD